MKQRFQGILFTDIETVPKAQHFADLGERDQQIFKDRFKKEISDYSKNVADISMTLGESGTIESQMNTFYNLIWHEKAALHAEFCKIVSIGMGYFGLINKDLKGAALYHEDNFEFRVKTVVDENEVVVLKSFFDALNTDNFKKICGHNFFGFDGPVLARRGNINKIPLPYTLNVSDMKNWEIPWIDTMKMFSYGEWGYKISLDRLCYALDVPTPKGEMTGNRVKDLFYGLMPEKHELPFDKLEYDKKEVRFKAIGTYQAGDIVATANCFLRLNDCDVIPEHKIKYV